MNHNLFPGILTSRLKLTLAALFNQRNLSLGAHGVGHFLPCGLGNKDGGFAMRKKMEQMQRKSKSQKQGTENVLAPTTVSYHWVL